MAAQCWSVQPFAFQVGSFANNWTLKAAAPDQLAEAWRHSLLLNMAIEIVSFPMNSMVIFHRYVAVYQRVIILDTIVFDAHFYCETLIIAALGGTSAHFYDNTILYGNGTHISSF